MLRQTLRTVKPQLDEEKGRRKRDGKLAAWLAAFPVSGVRENEKEVACPSG